jgi:hypothetical protein
MRAPFNFTLLPKTSTDFKINLIKMPTLHIISLMFIKYVTLTRQRPGTRVTRDGCTYEYY